MTNQTAAVTVIIPNYNGNALLDACLASIARQTFSDYEVVVVDNGSVGRDEVEAICGKYQRVRCIALALNHGFSAAVNVGIKASASPFFFLLNNDTELAPDCLEVLLKRAADLGDFHFFAPKMLSFHQRDILDGAGDGFLRGGAGYRLGTMERECAAYDQAGPVFGACAGAVLYRSAIFAEIGLFDEDFFAYLEDVDLNLRANRAGLRCYYIPQARVYHIGCATTGSKFNPITIRLSTRNSFFVLLKNYPLSLFFRYMPVIVVYQLLWLLFVIKKKQFLPYLQGLVQVFSGIWAMRRKRLAYGPDKLAPAEFGRCLTNAERQVLESIMRRRKSLGKENRLLRFYCRLFLSGTCLP